MALRCSLNIRGKRRTFEAVLDEREALEAGALAEGLGDGPVEEVLVQVQLLQPHALRQVRDGACVQWAGEEGE